MVGLLEVAVDRRLPGVPVCVCVCVYTHRKSAEAQSVTTTQIRTMPILSHFNPIHIVVFRATKRPPFVFVGKSPNEHDPKRPLFSLSPTQA